MATEGQSERSDSAASGSIESGGALSDTHTDDLSARDDKSQPLLRGPSRRKQCMQKTLGLLLSNWWKLTILGLVITMIVLISVKGFSVIGNILHWFERRNTWGGWGIFIGMFTGIIALFVPGIAFIMGAGYVFGFWKGLLAVWIGGSVGQALAFLLARYLLRDWVESMLTKRWPKWVYIDKVLETEGWKLLFLLRLSPIIPYNVLNIAMATTSMHFLQFTLVSSLGIIPECSIFVYFGTVADNLSSIVSGDAGPAKAYKWVLFGLSIAFMILGAVFVKIVVTRAIKQAQDLHTSTSTTREQEEAEEGQALLATPQPLARESFVTNFGTNLNTGLGRVAEAATSFKESLELKAVSAGKALTIPSNTPSQERIQLGQIKVAERTPIHVRSNSKAKMSPRADGQGIGNGPVTPFSASKPGGHDPRDVELGHSTSSRRRLVTADSLTINETAGGE